MPLSDSYIFKGIIFKTKKTKDEQNAFGEKWKEIEESLKGIHCIIHKIACTKLFNYLSLFAVPLKVPPIFFKGKNTYEKLKIALII